MLLSYQNMTNKEYAKKLCIKTNLDCILLNKDITVIPNVVYDQRIIKTCEFDAEFQ